LGDEDLTCLGAQIPDFGFKQLNLFPWSASANFQQSIDDRVEVHLVLIGHGGFASGGAQRRRMKWAVTSDGSRRVEDRRRIGKRVSAKDTASLRRCDQISIAIKMVVLWQAPTVCNDPIEGERTR
jgi:hypothetical protein